MITTVLFDLDGTLLPMDQEVFVQDYLSRMAKKLAPHGYDPQLLTKAVWRGTGAMVKNDGSAPNEALFWQVFNAVMGKDCQKDEPIFMDYYENEFQEVRHVCGFAQEAAAVIRTLKENGKRVALATNPLFPAIATQSRAKWAGLDPEDFALITTYENSCFCKPNSDYYREILGKLNAAPEECLMVGNDVQEDMMARNLGMQVFLLTDCLINRDGTDISQFPHGGFNELLDYIRSI